MDRICTVLRCSPPTKGLHQLAIAVDIHMGTLIRLQPSACLPIIMLVIGPGSQGMNERVGILGSLVGCGASVYTNQSQKGNSQSQKGNSLVTAINTSVTRKRICKYETESAVAIW